jgi:hypothetical protein
MFRAQQNAFDDAVGESCLEVILDLFGDPPVAGRKLDIMAGRERLVRRGALWIYTNPSFILQPRRPMRI